MNQKNVFRGVSLFSLTSLVVANMVGTGVFTSLGFQLAGLKSGFVLMVLWALGGLCALCGALCYAELGAALRRSGGEYHFLTEIYARPVGFLAGWVSATAGFAAPVALAAMALGNYLHGLHPALDSRWVALLTLVLTSAVHLLRPQVGLTFQNGFTLAKVLLILFIIGLGLLHPAQGGVQFFPKAGDGALFGSPAFAVSLVFVMYAYSGWNASTYVSGEVENPQRDIPRSLILGTGLVMLLYLGLNWAFLRSTPVEAMTGRAEVGLIAANYLLGPQWGPWMGGAIALLLVSTISSMIRVGPRVTQVMGEDHAFFRMLSVRSPQGIPARAILFQGGLSVLFVLTGAFDDVLVYAQFSLLACTLLAAFGVVLLRWKRPDLPRPYRTWGYPLTPLAYMGMTLWMMVYVLLDKPRQSLLGLASLLSGLVVYALTQRFASQLFLSRRLEGVDEP